MPLGSTPDGASTVLYIGGYGRSGSTVLDRVLGALPGAISVGEIRSIWGAVLREDRLCACGRPFSACPFWTEVGERAFGGWTSPTARRAHHAHSQVDRHRHLPQLLSGKGSSSFAADEAVFTDALADLYRAVAETGGADVVVDASKYPVYAAILRRVPGVDLRVVHLIRDARGAAYSWSKEGVVKPDATGDDTFMPTYRPSRASAEWLFYNAGFDALKALRVPTMRLYYERFVRDPRSAVARIAAFAGLPADEATLAYVDGTTIHLGGEEHALGGNPARFGDREVLTLRADQAWKDHMAPAQRRTVTTLTSPFLLRYGYLRSHGR
jgi:hypothetical protein